MAGFYKHHLPPATAEYILWGDQNEPRIFDFFLENNILTYLHKMLLQPSNRSGEVAKQVRTLHQPQHSHWQQNKPNAAMLQTR